MEAIEFPTTRAKLGKRPNSLTVIALAAIPASFMLGLGWTWLLPCLKDCLSGLGLLLVAVVLLVTVLSALIAVDWLGHRVFRALCTRQS